MLKANFLIPRATSIERKSKASRKEGTLLYLKSSLLLNSDSPWRKIFSLWNLQDDKSKTSILMFIFFLSLFVATLTIDVSWDRFVKAVSQFAQE